MATPKAAKAKKPKGTKPAEIEIEPGAWERFEKLVKSAAKMGHQAHDSSARRTKRAKPAKG